MNKSNLSFLEITEANFINFNAFNSVHGKYFCRCCQESMTNYDTDEDGYTFCCSSPVESKKDMLMSKKTIDIETIINKSIPNNNDKVYALSKLYSNTMEFGNASKTILFKVDLSKSVVDIIYDLKNLNLFI